MGLQIRRLSYALGAEITGVDIGKPADDTIFSEIHAAFLEHCVLLFRGQSLTQEQHLAFTQRFGEIRPVVASEKEINSVTAPIYSAQIWHTDGSMTLTPTAISLLRGVELPEIGGDTMFANMYLAYETLSDGMKKLVGGLDGVYVGTKGRSEELPPAHAHPLVKTHPETGRKSLYVGGKVHKIAAMTAEESEPLIQILCNHAARPQFCYRHRWQKDDLLVWDNRCTNHIAVGDYDRTKMRHMERTNVTGTQSGYVYNGSV
jgi:taurine dioxygenase